METKLPMRDKKFILDPHIVILGAGASLACLQNGDINGRKLPLMKNLVEMVGLSDILGNRSIHYENRNFEDIFNEISSNADLLDLKNVIEESINDYFYNMQIPNEPTLYDSLIVSLREKDLIASFNWDPLLLQAYRRNIGLKKLPALAFLHGNVGMGVCGVCGDWSYIDVQCNKCKKSMNKVDLLYPIKKKNYSENIVIKKQWDCLRYKLERAYCLTIFGYAAPISDIEAKQVMMSAWTINTHSSLSQIEIIDIENAEAVEKRWEDFLLGFSSHSERHHHGIMDSIEQSQIWNYPRRSCEVLDNTSLLLSPQHPTKIPIFKTIEELHKWIEPLVKEESM